jgi:hypothetical protein
MAKYDVQATISEDPPTYRISLVVGHQAIDLYRDDDSNWAGSADGVDLDDPAPIEMRGRGISNQKWNLAITLTPSGGGTEIDYKKIGHLDNHGFSVLDDEIKLS